MNKKLVHLESFELSNTYLSCWPGYLIHQYLINCYKYMLEVVIDECFGSVEYREQVTEHHACAKKDG